MITDQKLKELGKKLEGELCIDELSKILYSTDASVYKKKPIAVAFPKTVNDLKALVSFATIEKIGLIPRTAGTSLAGQSIGNGIVVDIAKHFTKTLDFDIKKQTIVVEPGVIRDDLNRFLKPYDLFFSPNTSTSNRCMIGGMVGNNSSGSTSLRYGVTRDKVIEIHAVLSDRSEVIFKEISKEEFHQKRNQNCLEGKIYQKLYDTLSARDVKRQIQNNFPKPEIHRRNTGYAIDTLVTTDIFSDTTKLFNICSLLSGSEGTLAFITKIKLQLDPLPPKENLMLVLHFSSILSCMYMVEKVMKYELYFCEVLDKTILDCTKENLEQQKNRFFIKGDPQAILMVEIRSDHLESLETLKKNSCLLLIPLVYVKRFRYYKELK